MFDFFKRKPRRFVSEEKFRAGLDSQLSMTAQTIGKIRELGVEPDRQQKLEYFFYTDKKEKAVALADALTALDYTSEFGFSVGSRNKYLVTGWSTPVTLALGDVNQWTRAMCELGFEHDCEFDGWGTNVEP